MCVDNDNGTNDVVIGKLSPIARKDCVEDAAVQFCELLNSQNSIIKKYFVRELKILYYVDVDGD